MGDVTLSASAVLAITGLLAALSGAIGILFRALLSAKNEQIERERGLTDKLLPAVEANTSTLQQLVNVLARNQERERDREHEWDRERERPPRGGR